MVTKLAIFVCPVPGCPSISPRREMSCPNKDHNRAMQKEVYQHKPSDTLKKVEDLAHDIYKAFGGKS